MFKLEYIEKYFSKHLERLEDDDGDLKNLTVRILYLKTKQRVA